MVNSFLKPKTGSWSNALFILPYLIFFIGMLVYPLILGIELSFYKLDLFGPGRFVGFKNYVRLFSDKIFIQSVMNTLYFVVLTVPAIVLISLFIAIALNQESKTSGLLRGIFFSSSVLSVTIVTLIWRIVFIPNDGLLANLFVGLGWEPIGFLSRPEWALVAVAITTIWWCIGLPMMLFLAALQQVPKEVYEAAALDNTSKFRTFLYITVPSIMRTIILTVIIEIILQFQLFGQAQLMTNGGPNGTSRPIVMFIYDAAYKRWDIGYAAAASQVLFAMILVAAMAQYFFSSRKGHG
ncbi:MAG: sugar ABC transporter permease [Alphaproteobacteria bacterium]|nr:sugar ABC transporter permease [Alphaproteobacteria bacterium]